MDEQTDRLRAAATHALREQVGLVMLAVDELGYAQRARGAAEGSRPAGYMMVVVNSNGDTALEVELLQMLRRREVDGVIASLVSDEAAESRDALGARVGKGPAGQRRPVGRPRGWGGLLGVARGVSRRSLAAADRAAA